MIRLLIILKLKYLVKTMHKIWINVYKSANTQIPLKYDNSLYIVESL